MPIPFDRYQQAAIDRLNLHIGRIALADYEATRKQIEAAKSEQEVRDVLLEAVDEVVRL